MRDKCQLPEINTNIEVYKINEAIPFYLDANSYADEELDIVNHQLLECREQIVKLIEERKHFEQFSISESDRKQLYSRFRDLKHLKAVTEKKVKKKLIEQKKAENQFH